MRSRSRLLVPREHDSAVAARRRMRSRAAVLPLPLRNTSDKIASPLFYLSTDRPRPPPLNVNIRSLAFEMMGRA